MSTYLIVDTDSKARQNLKKKLQELKPKNSILETDCVEQALLLYIVHKPNMVFMDVKLRKENAFELVHELMELGEHPRVAIVTKSNQYAIKALRMSAVDYLVKPINKEQLQFCLNRIQIMEEDELERQKMGELFLRLKMHKRIRINTRVGFEIIKSEDILYCEADGNYTNICLVDGKKQTTSTTLGSVVQQLPQEQFFRIGRSVVINLDYLKSVNRKERICLLCSEDQIFQLPLSLNRVQELSQILM